MPDAVLFGASDIGDCNDESDDATVKANSPDVNFGLDTDLQVDMNPHNNFLIKFVVSGLNGRNVLARNCTFIT